MSIPMEQVDALNSMFHEAIELNNTGVDHYKKGQYDESIHCLTSSLTKMQKFSLIHRVVVSRAAQKTAKTSRKDVERFQSTVECRHPAQQMDLSRNARASVNINVNANDNERQHASSLFAPYDDSDIAINLSTPDPTQCPTRSSSTNEREEVFVGIADIPLNGIYRTALTLVCHGDSTDAIISCSREVAARTRASILFNLGLAHHMLAAHFSSSWTRHRPDYPVVPVVDQMVRVLQQAERFYQLSLRIQEFERAAICLEYLMALCNNIGHCHSCLGNESESKYWVERLLCMLLCYQQSMDSDHIPQSAMDCFLCNTSMLILIHSHAAPTA